MGETASKPGMSDIERDIRQLIRAIIEDEDRTNRDAYGAALLGAMLQVIRGFIKE